MGNQGQRRTNIIGRGRIAGASAAAMQCGRWVFRSKFVSALSLCYLVAVATASPGASTGEAASGASTHVVHVRLHGRVVVRQGTVVVSTLADIRGPKVEVERVGQIVVGPAPLPGRQRKISRGYIKIRIRAAGIDADHIAFEGPDEVVVVGAHDSGGAEHSHQGPHRSPGDVSVRTKGKAKPLVRRGQPLVVRARYGMVEVRAEAVAMEDGWLGDVVRVQVRQGRARILVRLVGPRIAEVLR